MPQTPNIAPAIAAAPTAQSASGSSRSRLQASRKRVSNTADDAAYHGVSNPGTSAGIKRSAPEKPEGEPRQKRKRLDGAGASGTSVLHPSSSIRKPTESDPKLSLIDFTSLPTAALHRYLVQFDLVPEVDPSPLTAEDPPPPPSLLRQRSRRHASTASPGPMPITPANRPRREPSASRRRSSRLVEDETSRLNSINPVLADVQEVHGVLATIAERHFREHTVKEVDTLASFIFAMKAKSE